MSRAGSPSSTTSLFLEEKSSLTIDTHRITTWESEERANLVAGLSGKTVPGKRIQITFESPDWFAQKVGIKMSFNVAEIFRQSCDETQKNSLNSLARTFTQRGLNVKSSSGMTQSSIRQEHAS
jgi:hypothetical protein